MRLQSNKIREQLLQCVTHIVGENSAGVRPTEYALERGWLDARGNVTETGRALIIELAEQEGTRSVFRNL